MTIKEGNKLYKIIKMTSNKITETSRRHKFLIVRISEEESQKIKEKAEFSGMTASDYVRKNVINAHVSSRGKKSNLDHKILGQLLGQIGRIGNNINQLTRNVNSGIIPHPSNLDKALADWCQLECAILDVLNPNNHSDHS